VRLCSSCTVLMSVRSWNMVVLCMVQLENQSLSVLTVCRMLRCALVLEHLERSRLQAYMWKRENCPLNYDANNYIYNISVNFNQIHATHTFNSVFGTGFRRVFEARPNTIPTLGIRLNQLVVDSEINLNSIAINTTPNIPPWVLKPPGFQLSLHLLGNKSEVSPTVYQ